MGESICAVEGCHGKVLCRGWCTKHYGRWQRHGDPEKLANGPRPIADRFWPKVDKDGPIPECAPELGPCWLWIAKCHALGYGQFKVGTKMKQAHRVGYELLVGPVPDGLDLDHLCRVRGCVNPAHLEPVTHRENILRGDSRMAENARKTYCSKGHEYTPENTYVRPAKPNSRFCRECGRQATRAWEVRTNRAERRRQAA